MLLEIKRDVFADNYTLGKMYVDGAYFGEVCEDKDRKLESGGIKIPKQTAIPRGRYKVITSFSNRFRKVMLEVLNVPQFSGVRIHGGNTSDDTEGCPLLGKVRTANGVTNCAERNATLFRMVDDALERGDKVELVVS